MKQSLKLNWPEDDLRLRGQSEGAALILDDGDDVNLDEEDAAEEPPEWMDDGEKAEMWTRLMKWRRRTKP